ncbi:MAG: hypothetical protein IJW25_02660 [Clostridia bacterium]|nr:hypothetical protein [Clostridia bacterium]
MFIERLSDAEIKTFIESNIQDEYIEEYCSVNRYGNEGSLFLRLMNGSLRCISFNDFNIGTEMENVDVDGLKSAWKNFIYQKFGEEYKQAFNDNLRKKYEQELIK